MVRIIGLVMLAIVAASAQAQKGSTKWADVGNWEVRVDTTLEYGCFVYSVFEGNTVFRVGINRVKNNLYFMLADDDWRSLESGKVYDLSIEFDNEGAWQVPARGTRLNEQAVALVGQTSESLFIVEFMERHVMKVRYEGDEIVRLSLDGSYRAVQEMFNCQKQIDAYQDDEGDPFDGGPDDPFGSRSPKTAPDNDPF